MRRSFELAKIVVIGALLSLAVAIQVTVQEQLGAITVSSSPLMTHVPSRHSE
jgi:hypothetical protein